MGRNIILDAQPINEINRGSKVAADTLLKLKQDGASLYMSQQAMWELTANNPDKKEAAANAATLQEFGIQPAPPGTQALRQEFLAKNTGKSQAVISDGYGFQKEKGPDGKDRKVAVESYGIGNLRDAGVAAQAYALDFELLSGEKAFRTDRQQEMDRSFASKPGEPKRRLVLAPENQLLYNNKAPFRDTDFARGRTLLKLPPMNMRVLPNGSYEPIYPGRGPAGGPNSGANGMKSHEDTQTKMIGGIIAVGIIVSWLDDYAIESAMKKDIEEWEAYVRKRQTMDPENGFLLVAIIKKLQLRDAVYATRSYVSMEMFEGYTKNAAEAKAQKNILPGLPPPTDTVSYTYVKMWIAPLKPRPVLTAEQSDEKTYGSESWFPRFRLVRHSLEPPAEVAEALGILQGSSMYDILRVLDALPESQFNQLRSNLNIVKEAINKARFRVAFAAVQNHKSSSSFGSGTFLRDRQNAEDLAMLDDSHKKCIMDWTDSGTGAVQHVMQGRWEIALNGKRFEYSFKLSGEVTWRDMANPGAIGGEGSWDVIMTAVRVQWPKTGTVETFPLPLNQSQQKARSVMKNGSFEMTAKKTNPYP